MTNLLDATNRIYGKMVTKNDLKPKRSNAKAERTKFDKAFKATMERRRAAKGRTTSSSR